MIAPLMPRRAPAVVTGLLLALAAGCASSSEDTAYPLPETRAVAGHVGQHIDTRIDTLERVMPEAVGDMHWGLVNLTNEVTALYASAVSDTDQIIEIRAQVTKAGGVDVQVRVGHFGSEKLEREFLAVLAERAGKWDQKHGR